jgi:hypothetical protein
VNKLCPNCESHKHSECCKQCGRLVRTPRRDTGFCSLRCEREQARQDEQSAQMEENDQAQEKEPPKFLPEIAVCDMGYGFRGYLRATKTQPWIPYNRRIIFNHAGIEQWIEGWLQLAPSVSILRYADPLGRSPDDTWPRACSRCLHLHSSPEQAKFNGQKYFCTWCGDNAPPLVLVSPDNQASAQSA